MDYVQLVIEGKKINTLPFEVLKEIHNMSKPMSNWFKNNFFTEEIYLNNKDQVPVGDIKSVVPVAPLVSHKVQGRIIKDSTKANVRYVDPMYLKPAKAIEVVDEIDADMDRLLQSINAYKYGKSAMSSVENRVQYDAAAKFSALMTSIDMRINLECRNALLNGEIDVVSDDFEALHVDFDRHEDLKFSPAPTKAWNKSGATPYKDQKEMVKRLVTHGKKRPKIALTSSLVFEAMASNEEWNKHFLATKDTNATRMMEIGYGHFIEATLRGTVDGIQYWTNDEEFDVSLTETERLIPEDGFWMISEVKNRLYFCPIKHRKNPQKLAHKYFPYHVPSDDPSVDKFIMESSPLPVPVNKNGVCGGTGFWVA